MGPIDLLAVVATMAAAIALAAWIGVALGRRWERRAHRRRFKQRRRDDTTT